MSKLERYGRRPGARGTPPPGEASTDVAVVRAMYRALEEESAPDLVRRVAPTIEWVHPMVARLPFDGTRRGLPAVLRAAFRRDASGMGPRLSPETFVEFGDGVLVVGRFLGSGDEAHEEPFLHECFVRGGKVSRIREYPARRGVGDER